MAVSAIHVLLVSILIAVLYRPAESENPFRPHGLETQRILLVTAHPDDECLFFAPTLLSLISRSHEQDNIYKDSEHIEEKTITDSTEVFALCLSIGDADGLGEVRREEYQRSLDVLGVKDTHRAILDHSDLQDNITVKWDPKVIADVVQPYVLEHGITTILTFDRAGISEHPNHKALPLGIKEMLAKGPLSQPPKFYTLITVPLSIKYISVLAPFMAKFDLYTLRFLHFAEIRIVSALQSLGFKGFSAAEKNVDKDLPVFVSGFNEYLAAHRAMREHWSQLVWFRWLNVLFSRYMWVNEWAEIRVTLAQ